MVFDDNVESRSKPLPDGQPKKCKTTSLASAPVREKDGEAVVSTVLEEGLLGMQFFHRYVIFRYDSYHMNILYIPLSSFRLLACENIELMLRKK